jgi:hypothetical protein
VPHHKVLVAVGDLVPVGIVADGRRVNSVERDRQGVFMNTHMECGLSSGQGLFAPLFVGLGCRRGERIGCRRRLCRDSYARVGAA